MAKDSLPDPFDTVREVLNQWERGVDAIANRVMGSEEFTRSMNQMQKLHLRMQRAFADAMAEHLKNLNMPSRDDMTRIDEGLQSLERRMAHIEELLAAQQRSADQSTMARKGPPRTKRPPSQRDAEREAASPQTGTDDASEAGDTP